MLRHEYADLNGIRLHYVTAGEGKLIMFAHGFPEFWYEWKNQLAEFGRDYRAVAPDMRGYNLSSKPADVDQYRVGYLVEDLRALAEHLGHKKFVLVGHDWGGAVAWAFAIFHPDYLEKLIIINAPHPGVFERELRENPAQQRASQYMLMFRSARAEQTLWRTTTLRWWMLSWLRGSSRVTSPKRIARRTSKRGHSQALSPGA
jgi:pimeloyl-ACP methyl ester carboxylesterase